MKHDQVEKIVSEIEHGTYKRNKRNIGNAWDALACAIEMDMIFGLPGMDLPDPTNVSRHSSVLREWVAVALVGRSFATMKESRTWISKKERQLRKSLNA